MSFDLVGKAVKFMRLPAVDYLNAPTKIIPAQQNDVNSRYFRIKLYDDRGDIDFTGYRAVLTAELPDGEIIYTDGEVSSNGEYAVCVLSGDMLKTPGKIKSEITFFKGDSSGNGNGVQITSQTFYVLVSPSISNDDAVEGSSGYGLLLDVLEELAKAEEERKKAEESRVAAEETRKVAEEQRIQDESNRVASEMERVNSETNRKEAELIRVQTEDVREHNEAERNIAEQERIDNENGRIEAEQERANAEVVRTQAENTRLSAENARLLAENERVEAENGRASAENNRVAEFDEIKENCENATSAANNAKIQVDKVLASLEALPSAIDYTSNNEILSVVSLHFVEEDSDEMRT